MYKKIAITNRHLCDDLIRQIERLDKSDFDYIILREKDMPYEEYFRLAKNAVEISGKIILHTYIEVCEALNYRKIHLPYAQFVNNCERIKSYDIKGVSIHAIDEAVHASQLGCTYVTASHIFPTKCKEGLAPRGVSWLHDVCAAADTAVYALGGIHEYNAAECIKAGADGICMMSKAMTR